MRVAPLVLGVLLLAPAFAAPESSWHLLAREARAVSGWVAYDVEAWERTTLHVMVSAGGTGSLGVGVVVYRPDGVPLRGHMWTRHPFLNGAIVESVPLGVERDASSETQVEDGGWLTRQLAMDVNGSYRVVVFGASSKEGAWESFVGVHNASRAALRATERGDEARLVTADQFPAALQAHAHQSPDVRNLTAGARVGVNASYEISTTRTPIFSYRVFDKHVGAMEQARDGVVERACPCEVYSLAKPRAGAYRFSYTDAAVETPTSGARLWLFFVEPRLP